MKPFDVSKALEELETHLFNKTAHIRQLMSVHLPAEKAPDNLARLYRKTQLGKFNVWSGASDKTIFSSPTFNHLYREYHDFYHLLFNAGTTPDGELALWVYMVDNNLFYELPEGTRTLLHIEHVGQVLYYQEHGDFPKNQVVFMLQELLKRGLTPVNVPSHWWTKAGVCQHTITGETLTETAMLQVVKGFKNA